MIVVVAGTRPEHIKLAPVIRELRSMGRHVRVVWTGQHSDAALAADVFAATGGPVPDVSLRWPALRHGRGRPSKIDRDHAPRLVWSNATALGPALREHVAGASVVLVQGDTASALAGALAANRYGVRLAHLEAGLRSHDWTMPEEHVRVAIDREADLLLTPSAACSATCRIERAGLVARTGSVDRAGQVETVGQTGIDSLVLAASSDEQQGGEIAARRADLFGPDRAIALVTLHRAALADDPPLLRHTMRGILAACADRGLRVVWALHPRVAGDVRHAKTSDDVIDAGGRTVDPIDYRVLAGMLLLPRLGDRMAVLTDSGGLAEDAAFAGVPTVILRPSTERQELLSMRNSRTSIVAPSIASETVRAGIAAGIKELRVDYCGVRNEADCPFLPPIGPTASRLAARKLAAFADAKS